MKIRIKDLRDAPYDADIHENWSDFESSDTVSYYADSPATGHFWLVWLDDKVLLRMDFSINLVLSCARCLERVSCSMNRHVDMLLYPAILQAELLDIDRQAADIGFYHEDIIDTTDYIWEEIQLNIPMKPLCSEECRGLCQQCGTNLNAGTCECEIVHSDPRWDALQKFKETLST